VAFSNSLMTPSTMMKSKLSLASSFAIFALSLQCGYAFTPTSPPRIFCNDAFGVVSGSTSRQISLSATPPDNEEFSRQVRLREETESPFRKVRYFFYLNAAGGSFTSLAISLARIAAAASGVNTDLMGESLRNAGIDVVVLAVVAVFYKRDVDAEQSRLKRATKGAEIAKLNVRASKGLLGDGEDGTFTTPLASLRRGRGIEKRLVIVAAGSEKINQVIDDARELDEELVLNDLVVVPLVLPEAVAPILEESTAPKSVATPVSVGNSWKEFIEGETAEAVSQGVDVEKEGLCVILKKNGRVGQRTRGIFLDNLVGNVVSRRNAGMDVTNI
jgi:hypothetical protein